MARMWKEVYASFIQWEKEKFKREEEMWAIRQQILEKGGMLFYSTKKMVGRVLGKTVREGASGGSC